MNLKKKKCKRSDTPQKSVTFTEEIINGKRYKLCSVKSLYLFFHSYLAYGNTASYGNFMVTLKKLLSNQKQTIKFQALDLDVSRALLGWSFFENC